MTTQADITLVSSYHPGVNLNEPGSSFPLSCAYLIAALRGEGYTVEFRDYQFCDEANPLRAQTFRQFLENSAPIIGISSVSSMLPTILVACEAIKREFPEKTIILGGPGPASTPWPILHHYPAVDIIGIGEGEQTIVDIMDCLLHGNRSNLHHVQGIMFRDGGEIIATKARPRLRNLDELPFITDALDLMPSVEEYGQIHLMMARGCTYACTFCSVAPLWGRRNTTRTSSHVLEEISRLVERDGITRIVFADDLFTLVRKRVIEFCAAVQAHDLNFRWGCHGRINLVDESLMETMAGAGCDAIFYGVESGAERIIQDVKAGFHMEDVINVIELSLAHFSIIKPSFIWGFPFETIDEFMQSLMLMIYLRERGCASRTSMLIPEPLSPLYQAYRDQLALDFSLARHGVLGMELVHQFTDDMLRAIAAHPDIFSVYYHIPHEGLTEKVSIMDRLPNFWVPQAIRQDLVLH